MNDNTTAPTHGKCIDRRTVLSGLSATLVALAGCSSSPSEPTSPGSETSPPPGGESDAFERVAMTETGLVVELASDTNADSVNLINPNGEMNSLQRVQEGATQVTFQLLGEAEDGYTPGEYRVVAVAGDEPIGKTTISLEPELTITDVMWAQNHPDMDWDKDRSTWQQLAAFSIENTGNAPSFLTMSRWTDAPLCRVKSQETMEFGHNTLLPAGETTTVYSSAPIYQTEGRLGMGAHVNCSDLGTAPLTVTGAVQAGANPSYSQTIEYGGTNNSCELTIVDGGPTDSTQTTSNGEDA
jgi:hypothetical protein